MKKTYIQPSVVTVKIETYHMIAGSLPNSTFGGGSGDGSGASVSARGAGSYDDGEDW